MKFLSSALKAIYFISFVLLFKPTHAHDKVFHSELLPSAHSIIHNYPTSDFRGARQIWGITKGHNDLIYFTAGDVFEYGDNYWHRIINPTGYLLRSINKYKNNSYLVGGPSIIAEIIPGVIPGEYEFVSLMDKLDKEYHSFGEIWQIIESEDIYYLRAGKAILELANDTIKPLLFGDVITHIELINDQLYYQKLNNDLCFLKGNESFVHPQGDFMKRKYLKGLVETMNDRYLLLTQDHGIYVMDSTQVVPMNKDLNQILSSAQIMAFAPITRNVLAIGTIKNGLFIIDHQGNILQHFNKSNGLINNSILTLELDHKNNLWVGTHAGLSYIEIGSDFMMVNSSDDIGSGFVSALHDNKLYLGTNQGLYLYDLTLGLSLAGSNIQPVSNTTNQVWCLKEINNNLYCGHHSGIFHIQGDQAVQVVNLEGVWNILDLENYPGYAIASTYRGLFLLQEDPRLHFILIGKIETQGNSIDIREDQYGNIWQGKDNQKLIRFRINTNVSGLADSFASDSINGNSFNRIKILGKKGVVIFATDNGVYEYDYQNDKIVRSVIFDQLFQTTAFNELYEDKKGRIWFSKPDEIGYFSIEMGVPRKHSLPFVKILDSYTHQFGEMSIINDHVIFPNQEGFLIYSADYSEKSIKKYPFKSYIRSMNTSTPAVRTDLLRDSIAIPVYKHPGNSYQFIFSSNSFEKSEVVEYSYSLIGFHADWTPFSQNNIVNFTNLKEGTYSLNVKARDVYGNISETAIFHFKILPPFYRSSAAYAVYVLLVVLLFYLLYIIRNKQIEREHHKVENQKQQELKVQKEQFQTEQLISQQRITELENEKLQQNLILKAKELSNSTINILRKNEILIEMKEEIQEMSSDKDTNKRNIRVRQLVRKINQELETQDEWEIFDKNLNEVHEEFVRNIKEKFSELNQNDIRLCIFLKMNKTTKEIATLLNLSIRGVETSRYRLRKKMGLSRDDSLTDAILSI